MFRDAGSGMRNSYRIYTLWFTKVRSCDLEGESPGIAGDEGAILAALRCALAARSAILVKDSWEFEAPGRGQSSFTVFHFMPSPSSGVYVQCRRVWM